MPKRELTRNHVERWIHALKVDDFTGTEACEGIGIVSAEGKVKLGEILAELDGKLVRSNGNPDHYIRIIPQGLPDPIITDTITGYQFTWSDLTITARRVEVHKDGRITGFLTIQSNGKKLSPESQFNFSAGASRVRLAKDLKAVTNAYDWEAIVSLVCEVVLDRAKAGDEGSTIEADDEVIIPPRHLVEPFILEGVPNVIYGDKTTRKTTLALMMAGLMALGRTDNPLELRVSSVPLNVGILDWESDERLTKYNLLRIRKGLGLPYFNVAYKDCRGFALWDNLDAISSFLSKSKTEVAILDSLVGAAGGDLMDGESAQNFYRAAARLPCKTLLIIGQNPKAKDNKTLMGSNIYTYLARNIFELRGSEMQNKDNRMVITVTHKYSNFTRHYPPMGFQFVDADDSVTVYRSSVTIDELAEKASRSQLIINYMRRANVPVNVHQIAADTGLTEGNIRTLLTREKQAETVIALGRGLYALADKVNRQEELPEEEGE